MIVGESTHDLNSGVCEIVPSGVLDLAGTGHLRALVLKSLAEQPTAIIINLNDVWVDDATAALILPALERRAVADFGVHLRCVLAADHADRAMFAQAFGRHFPAYPTRAEALAAGMSDAAASRRLHVRLLATETAPAVARAVVDDTCRAWNVEHISDDAQTIVSELATNAIRHTGLDFDVVLLWRPPYLHIQVIDTDERVPLFPMAVGGEPVRPRPGQIGGWGLYLVYALASGCGVTIRRPGKIVWATLRGDPVSVARRR